MATTSALSLSEKLEQRQQAAQQDESNRISELLKKHEESLAELSTAALDTTKTVTGDQLELLAEALRSERQLLKDHAGQMSGRLKSINSELDGLGKSAIKRLGWWLMWPLLITALMCSLLTLGAAAWSWWVVKDANDQAIRILSDQRIQHQQLNREFCSSPAGQKYCRPSVK